MDVAEKNMISTSVTAQSFYRESGKTQYELSNHLGNVLTVITDKKQAVESTTTTGTVDYFVVEILSASDYSPFGVLLQNREFTSAKYRFGFGNHEKLDEVSGSGNVVDMGDRWLDTRLGRTPKPDKLKHLYAGISPYAFALNNPIIFMDADGKVVIGMDGKPVTYERGQDGVVKWSENASQDAIKVGNAMLATASGEASFNRWQNSKTAITIVIDRDNQPSDRTAETDPERGENGKPILNEDGQYQAAKVIFYDKSIQESKKDDSGTRWAGASEEEAYGAIGVHEEGHNDPAQIKLDKKTPNELKQDPSKNKPINNEIDYRNEYHDKKPGQKNEKTWKENYKKAGYNTDKKQD
jgi:RHS repeat-associated protein